MTEAPHDHELEVLEADENVPPRPEEAIADAADDKVTPPEKGEQS
ncbi:MAG: hypothetical protein JWM93_3430 [Frankiales bacterium]|nr:hypothetical protein [Frankiales bacterium]